MKRIIAVLLLISLVLCGCGKKEASPPATTTTTAPETTVPPTTSEPPETTVPPTTAPPETTVPPTTVPEPEYVNPLNGEGMYEPYTGKPVAVMLNNVKKAQPQHGVSGADILFEMSSEGGSTRCMGIYSDITNVPRVGAVRSVRLYFAQVMQGFDALLVHAGGSAEATAYLNSLNIKTINGVSSAAFYRDQDRLNAGYSKEHTLFIDSEAILSEAEKKKVTMTGTEEVSYGFQFAEEIALDGEDANVISVYFSRGGKANGKLTKLTYDADANVYKAYQFENDYIDGQTDEVVSFRNVIILRAITFLQEDQEHLTIETVGSGDGYFACDGKIVPIKWSRKNVNSPFVFTLEDGTPITLGVGKTYIPVVAPKSLVAWE